MIDEPCGAVVGMRIGRGKKSTRRKPATMPIFVLNLCGGTLGTAVTTGLLYQPRMIGNGDCGEIGELKIGRDTEVLGENLFQHHLVHQKSHMT
jgi:hypothetical protein